MSVVALPRYALRAVVAAVLVAVVVVLMSVTAHAQADPYPPSAPSSTAPVPQPAVTSVPHTTNGGSSSGLAETGFATLTATVIAVGLLGGGVLLVVLGRRRRAADK